MSARLEVADVFRDYGADYRQRHALSDQQRRVMHAIEVCRPRRFVRIRYFAFVGI